MTWPVWKRPVRITLAATAIALVGLAFLARSQVYSTQSSTTSFSGASCTNCSMSTLTLTSPVTLDGLTLKPDLAGTTGTIGGGLLTVGCTSGTVAVTGAAGGMVASATPNTFPGNNIQWQAYVSSAGIVTVSVCTSLTLTPTASVYYVRVIQ